MMIMSRRSNALFGTALSAMSFFAAATGCASEREQPQEVKQQMALRGTAQALVEVDSDAALRVGARWSSEGAGPRVYTEIADVAMTGANPGAFDMRIVEPPMEAMDHDSDGDYFFSSAQLVLLDNDSLSDGWLDPQLLWESEVGMAEYEILFVDSDMPASSRGHFGIGPVNAGFHLLHRLPDEIVIEENGSGGIAVWEEVPLDTRVEIAVGSDGNPTPDGL